MGRRKATYIFVPDKPVRRRGPGCMTMVVILLLAALCAVLVLNYATNRRVELHEEKVSVMGLDKAFEGFTVLHISDLQASPVGSDMKLWRDLLYGKNYHAVVLSGDMVGYKGDYEPLLSLIHTLGEIRKDVPVYFIAGDEDPLPVVSTPQGTPEALSDWVRATPKAWWPVWKTRSWRWKPPARSTRRRAAWRTGRSSTVRRPCSARWRRSA